jgi:hypothetical protein
MHRKKLNTLRNGRKKKNVSDDTGTRIDTGRGNEVETGSIAVDETIHGHVRLTTRIVPRSTGMAGIIVNPETAETVERTESDIAGTRGPSHARGLHTEAAAGLTKDDDLEVDLP